MENKINPSRPRFPKDQLVRSQRFAEHRDILSAVLEDDRLYTIEAAEKAIEKFLTTEVN